MRAFYEKRPRLAVTRPRASPMLIRAIRQAQTIAMLQAVVEALNEDLLNAHLEMKEYGDMCCCDQ